MGQVDPNKDFLLEYMASFCDKIPTDAETQDWCLCDRTAKQHMMAWLWLGKAAFWAGIFGCANVVQDALVWASQIYGLNLQFSSEAEHRVAQLHSLHSMWFFLLIPKYASTIRWRAQTYIIYYRCWWVSHCGVHPKAWATTEGGLHRAFAGYCMARFQKTSRARYFPQ